MTQLRTIRLIGAIPLTLCLGLSTQALALDLGSLSSGATIGGSNRIDVKTKRIAAIGFGVDSQIMIGHVRDGSRIGGSNSLRVNSGNLYTIGFNIKGYRKKACIRIATVGGHCL